MIRMTSRCRECGEQFSLSLPFSETVHQGVMQFIILIHVIIYHRECMTVQKTFASILTIIKGFLCFLFELGLKLVKVCLYPFYWMYTSINTRWY